MRQKEEFIKIGYVRVSKQEQHEALQVDALKEVGCEKWFLDTITGSKAERQGLDEALVYLRPGGKFIFQGMGALAEFERDLIGHEETIELTAD